ncbi:MAG: hypothetical protein ACYTGP_03325 [Planctomycetota bacterium]|jgi:hypothetical protein
MNRFGPWLWIALVAAAAGCVTETTRVDPTRRLAEQSSAVTGMSSDGTGAPGDRELAGDAHAQYALRSHVVTQMLPLGHIPYDNMTLPLASPDARYVVTQTGIPPEWETVLAQPGAVVPHTTRLEIYDISNAPESQPNLSAIVDQPVLLGRGCNAEGFLVEAPQEDGSRWIGLASWETGQVSWLIVDHGVISAFATIGPMGQIAYSARKVGAQHFELWVDRNGSRARLPSAGDQWLMPTWAPSLNNPEGLFVLRLVDDRLDLVHLSAASELTMRQTLKPIPLATANATIDTCYQTVVAQPYTVSQPTTVDEFIYFHPTRLRATLWRPGQPPRKLAAKSLGAVIDPDNDQYVIVTLGEFLGRHPIVTPGTPSRMLLGTHIPRRTNSVQKPLLLLEPQDGAIGLSAMQLLPVQSGGAAPAR